MNSGALFLLAFATFAVAAVAREASAEDPVLARLARISRGEWTAAAPRSAALPYAAEMRAAALRHGLSPSLLAGVVRAESAFDPRAVSSAGAQGLAQLMPRTARELGVADPFDPSQNLDAGARYLGAQYRQFGSVRLALAAYHAGPQRARGGLARVPSETLHYISRVLRFERDYRERGLP